MTAADRPWCQRCARSMLARSTRGPVTYYYCPQCGKGRKLARRPQTNATQNQLSLPTRLFQLGGDRRDPPRRI